MKVSDHINAPALLLSIPHGYIARRPQNFSRRGDGEICPCLIGDCIQPARFIKQTINRPKWILMGTDQTTYV
jgi:hypothetical protein